ncbi:MAG: hypothetical protein DWQ07_23230 [Chloroflexi bacterium]|nr:MAG: hypothetical protein DWQ07_23230 [Chloroflexota bacterium]MBL1194063.1 hypothetical protein [Chloroflexota bacterium]NOH11357.1 hypothetical protein [Chloroflexota bacterium]
MTEALESGAKREEAGENSQVSTAQRDEQTSGEVERPNSPLEKQIEEHIASEVERRFQSAKDKRWAQLERQYGALSELQKAMDGQDEIQATDDNWVIDKAQGLLKMAGLENDPEVSALLREKPYGADNDGYVALLSDLTEVVLRRNSRGPTNGAAVAQPSGGLPVNDLREDYELRKRQLVAGDVNALMALKREFRAKGLDIF